MRKITREVTELVFSDFEVRIVKEALLYARHRCDQHKESGINKVLGESDKVLLKKWLKNI
jgi:hypothetical protein